MKQIFKTADLKVGKQYLMVSKQFGDARNFVTMIAGDIAELGRDISYFIFTERASVIPNEQGFKKSMQSNRMVGHTFALWGFAFSEDANTELYELDPQDYKKPSVYGVEPEPEVEAADPNQMSLL